MPFLDVGREVRGRPADENSPRQELGHRGGHIGGKADVAGDIAGLVLARQQIDLGGLVDLLSGRLHMYIDPTTGSLVLQFLAAGVLSVLAMASRVREAVKSFFKMLLPRRRR